jgi:hypothetical protein
MVTLPYMMVGDSDQNLNKCKMENNVVSIEVAKLLKKLKYRIPTFHYYEPQGNVVSKVLQGYFSEVDMDMILTNFNDEDYEGYYSAPYLFCVNRWLREKHKHHVHPYPNMKGKWQYQLITFVGGIPYVSINSRKYFHTYEDALDAGIHDILNVIKQCDEL